MAKVLAPTMPGRSGLDYLAGRLPETQITYEVDCVKIVKDALQDLDDMPEDAFTEDALWRDQLAMCGTFRTIYGGKSIRAAWKEIGKERKPANFKLVEGSAKVTWLGATSSFVEGMFEFETMGGELPSTCSGFVYIVPSSEKAGGWSIWCLMTILEQFKGYEQEDLRLKFPEQSAGAITNGVAHSADPETAVEVDAIVLGAGQSGLCVASYLQSSGVKYLALERNKQIGDNWALRYDCLKLHTPHQFNDLAFGPTFTKSKGYSEWLTKDELAKGYRDHVARFHINVWTSSNVVSCQHSKDTMLWTLKVDREGTIYTVIGRHLILSTGPGGTLPIRPTYPGRELFQGEVLHSKDFKSAAGWKGKKGLVIGTANTGHDVAEDMLNCGLSSITMAQRGKTFVLPRDYNTTFFNMVWTPERSGELADRYFWAPPVQVARLATMNFFDPLFAQDVERFDKLEEAGFKLDRGGDFIEMLLVKFGGHFMDHGCSAKISDGLIKMKSDAAPAAYTSRGLKFSDGSEVEADVIVFATGFEKDTTESAAKIVGEEIASQLDAFWGCDQEGEVRGAFKPCGYPTLWMTGGGCGHARYYTRFVAMQIKADLLGRPLKIYTKTPAA